MWQLTIFTTCRSSVPTRCCDWSVASGGTWRRSWLTWRWRPRGGRSTTSRCGTLSPAQSSSRSSWPSPSCSSSRYGDVKDFWQVLCIAYRIWWLSNSVMFPYQISTVWRLIVLCDFLLSRGSRTIKCESLYNACQVRWLWRVHCKRVTKTDSYNIWLSDIFIMKKFYFEAEIPYQNPKQNESHNMQ